eukprot:TRINITY_DN1204_c0_g1_i1.p1 TRINITY_DN1204_c0_g1~~TRINITY_DN1204_c0_g1_i1.p1  ORF type:complete len:133 (+),score=0.90 TRINITY_DN1204_c0_g1_i1:95-493(+)
MMDNFGHYAIEALFQVSPDEQRLYLVGNLAPSIAIVSCHKQGSFSIQSIMESLKTQTEIEMIVEALSKHVMQIILNCSGHHVIIRFLSKFGWPLHPGSFTVRSWGTATCFYRSLWTTGDEGRCGCWPAQPAH